MNYKMMWYELKNHLYSVIGDSERYSSDYAFSNELIGLMDQKEIDSVLDKEVRNDEV